jgi:hypothetical protein
MALQNELTALRDALLNRDKSGGIDKENLTQSPANDRSIELIEQRVRYIGDPTLSAVFEALKEIPQTCGGSNSPLQNASAPLPLTSTILLSALLTLLSSSLVHLQFSSPPPKNKKKQKTRTESTNEKDDDANNNRIGENNSWLPTVVNLSANNTTVQQQHRLHTRTLAALRLLRMVLPTVSVPVLRQSALYEESLQFFTSLLRMQLPTSFLEHTLPCMKLILSAQSANVWSEEGTLRCLTALLHYAFHDDEKIRRRVHSVLVAVLQTQMSGTGGEQLAKWLCGVLREVLLSTAATPEAVCRALELSRALVSPLALHSPPLLKTLTEILLRVAIQNATHPQVLAGVLSVFESLFETLTQTTTASVYSLPSPSAPTIASSSSPTSPLAAVQYLPALFNALNEELPRPSVLDVAAAVSYVRALSWGLMALHHHFAGQETSLAVSKLPALCVRLLPYLLSEQSVVAAVTTQQLCLMLRRCLDVFTATNLLRSAVRDEKERATVNVNEESRVSLSYVTPIMETLHDALRVPYQRWWSKLIEVIGVLFEQLSAAIHAQHDVAVLRKWHDVVRRVGGALVRDVVALHSLARHETTTSRETTEYDTHVDNAVECVLGTFVSAVGIAHFADIVRLTWPLSLAEEALEVRSLWLLPLLAKRMHHVSLMYFFEKLLPVSVRLRELAREAEQQETRVTEARRLRILRMQLWDLFPAFCTYPYDAAEAFKLLAKPLAQILTDEPDLCTPVCLGLQHLILKTLSLSRSAADNNSRVRDTLAAVAAFSQHYLPGLFNLYLKAPSDTAQRNALYHTVEAFVHITDTPILRQLFQSLLAKINVTNTSTSAGGSPGATDLLIDLVVPLVPHITTDDIFTLYRHIVPLCTDSNARVQKRAFKAIAALARHHVGWLRQNLAAIHELLVNTSLSHHASTKATRLKILSQLLSTLGGEDVLHFLLLSSSQCASKSKSKRKSRRVKAPSTNAVGSYLLLELILGLKEVNAKVRDRAQETFLVAITRTLTSTPSTVFISSASSPLSTGHSSPSSTSSTQPQPSASTSVSPVASPTPTMSPSSTRPLCSTALLSQWFIALLSLLGSKHVLTLSAALHAWALCLKHPIVRRLVTEHDPTAASSTMDTETKTEVHTLDEISAAHIQSFPSPSPSAQMTRILRALPTLFLPLLASTHREVVSSVLSALTALVAQAYIRVQILQPHLSTLMSHLFGLSEQMRVHFKIPIKILLERLVVKLGFATVEPLVPAKHRRLLVNIRKSLERRLRKKRSSENRKEKQQRKKEIGAWIVESEDILDVGDEDHISKQRNNRVDDAVIVDFLDPRAAHYVVATNPDASPSLLQSPNSAVLTSSPFKLSEDGRLIIPEDDDDSSDETGVETSCRERSPPDTMGAPSLLTVPSSTPSTTTATSLLGKRKRNASDESDMTVAEENGVSATPQRAVKRPKHNGTGKHHFAGHSGEEYRSPKAAGDMKRAGRPDPYAYLPLNPRMLNKRRRLHAYKQFENVIKAAKKGAKAKTVKRKSSKKINL